MKGFSFCWHLLSFLLFMGIYTRMCTFLFIFKSVVYLFILLCVGTYIYIKLYALRTVIIYFLIQYTHNVKVELYQVAFIFKENYDFLYTAI